MKKIYIIIIILVLIVLIAFGIFIFIDIQNEKKEDAVALVLKENRTVEAGTIVKVSDFIQELKGELMDDFEIDTENVGTKTVTFNYKSQRNKKKTKSYDINIVDTTKPIIYTGGTVTVKEGYTGNVSDLIFSGDNIDSAPERTIIGDYDVNKIGSYKLKYNIKDKSGNEETQDFTLKVVNATSGLETIPSASKINFSKALERYKNEKTSIGIDVSQWQGNIDWSKVKEAGAEFAIIRIGYQKDYDAGYVIDPYFIKNINGAKEAGLNVGIYFYSYAKTVKEGIEQANWVADNLKEYEINLPIAFDWESWNSFVKCNLSFYNINKIARKFVETLEGRGYQGSLYSSKNFLQRVWYEDRFENIWLAHYTEETDYDKKYDLWQFCNTGRISGINGDVDIDVWYH